MEFQAKLFKNKSIRDFLLFYKVSKSNIYKLEHYKYLLINYNFQNFNYILKEDDVISIDLDSFENNNTIPFKEKIDIVYEDEDILIVNKPAYLLVHSDGNEKDTLNNRVSFYYLQNGITSAVRHIHRLDYETSGMVIYAKNFLVHSYLSSLLENHQITKEYCCICRGIFENKSGVIEKNIGKDRHSNNQIICKTGQSAKTIYKVANEKANKSFVQVQIIGGRKHQIRVHLASILHPIIGDKIYGKATNDRCLLHFKKVTFVHPRTLKEVIYQCKEPFKL